MKLADRAAAAVHAVHGTRGLGMALLAMLALTIIEPAIPVGFARAVLAFPVFVLAVIGLSTLPREGVAVQLRLRRLVEDEAAGRRLAKHLVFPLVLVVLLLPQSFLAAYGIPHFSPLTGLVLPSFQRRVAALVLFGLCLIPILHLRRTARYAPDVVALRPREIDGRNELHSRRDLMVVLTLAIAVLWLFLLVPFWQPFSLLAWPVSLSSFGEGIRGVAALAYSIFLPVVIFTLLAAHAQGLRHMIIHAGWRTHAGRFAALWAHLLLGLAAVALHIYDLLWIVRYQSAVGF